MYMKYVETKDIDNDMAQRLHEMKEKQNHSVYIAILITNVVWMVASMFLLNYFIGTQIK